MSGGERKIALAAVAGAHGVKGELRLKLFGESARSLSVHEHVYVGGALRRLLSIRDSGKTAVARFEGISDRSAAEALRGIHMQKDGPVPQAVGDILKRLDHSGFVIDVHDRDEQRVVAKSAGQ